MNLKTGLTSDQINFGPDPCSRGRWLQQIWIYNWASHVYRPGLREFSIASNRGFWIYIAKHKTLSQRITERGAFFHITLFMFHPFQLWIIVLNLLYIWHQRVGSNEGWFSHFLIKPSSDSVFLWSFEACKSIILRFCNMGFSGFSSFFFLLIFLLPSSNTNPIRIPT